MRKFTSLAGVVLAGLLLSACSNSDDKLKQEAPESLYEKGQTYLQGGDYNSAIRHLEAVNGRSALYGEQIQMSLIYANYKIGEYYKALDAAERFVRAYPNSNSMDYIYYLAGLSNARLGDNFIQDLFRVNRSSRALESIRNAYGSFQTIVQHFPHSKYAADAQNWMTYLRNRMAEHELVIAKFYRERDAYVAVANRIEDLIRIYPDSKAAHDGLPLLKEAFEKMGIQDSADKVAAMIEAQKDRTFPNIGKPAYGEQF